MGLLWESNDLLLQMQGLQGEVPTVEFTCRLRHLRQPLEGCSYPEALATSWDQFLHVDNLSVEACSAERVPYAATLGYQCPLLARKFSADVAQHMFDLMTDCSSRLNISRTMQC